MQSAHGRFHAEGHAQPKPRCWRGLRVPTGVSTPKGMLNWPPHQRKSRHGAHERFHAEWHAHLGYNPGAPASTCTRAFPRRMACSSIITNTQTSGKCPRAFPRRMACSSQRCFAHSDCRCPRAFPRRMACSTYDVVEGNPNLCPRAFPRRMACSTRCRWQLWRIQHRVPTGVSKLNGMLNPRNQATQGAQVPTGVSTPNGMLIDAPD